MSLLIETPLKLTQIASKMDISSTESHRHLSRLGEANLILRNSDGDYVATAYGKQVMRLVPGYAFLSKHSNYFINRDLSLIPRKFMYRIGELENAILVNDVMITLFDIDNMLKEANEFIHVMTNQMVMSHYQPLIDAAGKDIQIKFMRPTGWRLPDNVVERLDKEVLRAAFKQLQAGRIIQRELPLLPVFMAFSEREVSALSFPQLSGNLDYLGFKSDDNDVLEWCIDLYEYLWKRAKPGEVRTRLD